MPTRFRVLVVGRGLIGSAAARHLAGMTDGVAVVGPDEPPARAAHRDVFGSHYDEGRIYRVVDPSPTWARLALRSIERYGAIEAESGVPFHEEVGCLVVSPSGTRTRGGVSGGSTPPEGATGDAEAYARTSLALGQPVELLRGGELAARFPFLRFGPERIGAWQRERAGHISPRRLVQAQTIAAERRGAAIVREAVHRLAVGAGGVEATTASGRVLTAERALVATGAFASVHAVLPRALHLPVGGRTILLARVSDSAARELAAMPSLIVSGAALPGIYVLPPVRYPDGALYVKIGTGHFEHPLRTPEELLAWFRHAGAPEDRAGLHDVLVSLIPCLRGAPVHTDTCAVDATAHGNPYVDLVEDGRIAIAIGGNGAAAKSSDEIGRLGAELLVHGEWRDEEMPQEAFRARFAE